MESDEVADLCRRMGWDLLEVIDGKGAFADAGWNPGGDDEVEPAYRDGRLDDIMMQITEFVREKGAHRALFMRDALADAAAVVTAVLGGPPPGSCPSRRRCAGGWPGPPC